MRAARSRRLSRCMFCSRRKRFQIHAGDESPIRVPHGRSPLSCRLPYDSGCRGHEPRDLIPTSQMAQIPTETASQYCDTALTRDGSLLRFAGSRRRGHRTNRSVCQRPRPGFAQAGPPQQESVSGRMTAKAGLCVCALEPAGGSLRRLLVSPPSCRSVGTTVLGVSEALAEKTIQKGRQACPPG
jgi:hypothetical protein